MTKASSTLRTPKHHKGTQSHMPQKTVDLQLRAALAAVPAYKPGKPPAEVPGLEPYKLSSNEHFLPPLPEVIEALTDIPTPAQYPDPPAGALFGELANYLLVPAVHVPVGAGGADDLTAVHHIPLRADLEGLFQQPGL